MLSLSSFLFFFNNTAPTEIYTLSLHDALPISVVRRRQRWLRLSRGVGCARRCRGPRAVPRTGDARSEEHTSELQSHSDLVCRLLLEKKKKNRRLYEKTNSKMLYLTVKKYTQ